MVLHGDALRAPFVVTVEQSQLVDKHRPQREARRVGFSLGGHRLVSLKEDFVKCPFRFSMARWRKRWKILLTSTASSVCG